MTIPVRSRLFDDPAVVEQVALRRNFPEVDTAGTLTPAALGTTTCRVFPFTLPRATTLAHVAIKTPAALAAAFQFGIFDRTGARKWTSGAVATVAGYTQVTAGLPVVLDEGTHYFGVTNNNNGTLVTTAALAVSSALAAAVLPRWGTVTATAGAMPASINPAAITETVGGFPIYTMLSAFSS